MKEILTLTNANLGFRHYLKVLGLLTILMLLFYSNSISNDYSMDDNFIYTENELVTQGLDLEDIFTKNSFKNGSLTFGYRPIAILCFALEYKLFGINSSVSHTINLSLYLISCFLVFYFLSAFLPNSFVKLSLLTAILFLILPIHSEIANNVKCRDELLMLNFGLLALIFWLKSSKSKLWVVVSLFFLLLSILSKKSGYVFLGVLPLISYFRPKGNWKSTLGAVATMVLSAFAFRLISRKTKTAKGSRDYDFIENPLFDPDFDSDKLSIVIESIGFYFKKLLFPIDLVSYYGYSTIAIKGFGINSLIGLISIIACLVIVVLGIRSKKIYAFGVLLLLGSLLAISNLLMPMVGIVAERFITVGSIGFCIFIVFGVYSLLGNYKKAWIKYGGILISIYALFYLPQIRSRNAEWKNMDTLVMADVLKEPNSLNLMKLAALADFKAAVNATNVKDRTEKAKSALNNYNKFLEVKKSKEIYNEKGALLYKVYQKPKEAEKAYLSALEIDANYILAHRNLGILYDETSQVNKSLFHLLKVIENDPSELKLYPRIVKQLSNSNRQEEALRWIDFGIEKNGAQYELLLNKGHLYMNVKDYSRAIEWYQKAYQIIPNGELAQRIKQMQKAASSI